jgi:hypothetical protein
MGTAASGLIHLIHMFIEYINHESIGKNFEDDFIIGIITTITFFHFLI